jgi:hypothetical protein
MNWMYHGMEEGESRKPVLQESLGGGGGGGGLGESHLIVVEWKEGSMNGG